MNTGVKLCDENVDFCKYTLFFCLLLSLLCYGEIDAKKAILLLSFSPKFDSFPCHGTKKGIILLYYPNKLLNLRVGADYACYYDYDEKIVINICIRHAFAGRECAELSWIGREWGDKAQ